jgi:hypothetical protein
MNHTKNQDGKEFEDAKSVIGIRNSKDRQCTGQKKKYKRTNNALQTTTMKNYRFSNVNVE